MSVPYTRSLAYVLRDELEPKGAVRFLIAKVTAVPDPEHVTVEEGTTQFTIPRLSSYQPVVGEPALCIAADTTAVAIGAVGGTAPLTLPGHTIRKDDIGFAARASLNFVGAAVTVADDPGTNSTDVTVTGGAPVVQAAGPQGNLTITSATPAHWSGGPTVNVATTGVYVFYYGARMQSAEAGIYDVHCFLARNGATLNGITYTSTAQYMGGPGSGMWPGACNAGENFDLYVQCAQSSNYSNGWITGMRIAG